MTSPELNISNKKVLVLGGTGFIGRYAVKELLKQHANVIIGTRNPETKIKTIEQCEVHFELLTNSESWSVLLGNVDVVLNCVGILRPVGKASYDIVHHLAPAALSEACSKIGIRLVHVSALGLNSNVRSGFLISKKSGEVAIQSGDANWIIVRPSLLDGDGGYGAAWLRGIALLPLFIVPNDALGKIAALSVTDLGIALTRLCLDTEESLNLRTSREFELGGTLSFNFEEYIRGLRSRHTQNIAWCIRLPSIIARLGAHICDLLNITPFSFGHWELLRNENVPKPNRLPELLGREPTPVIEEL